MLPREGIRLGILRNLHLKHSNQLKGKVIYTRCKTQDIWPLVSQKVGRICLNRLFEQ